MGNVGRLFDGKIIGINGKISGSSIGRPWTVRSSAQAAMRLPNQGEDHIGPRIIRMGEITAWIRH